MQLKRLDRDHDVLGVGHRLGRSEHDHFPVDVFLDLFGQEEL